MSQTRPAIASYDFYITFMRCAVSRFRNLQNRGSCYRPLVSATKYSHWRVIAKDNVTSVYGLCENSRISDPNGGANNRRIFKWLLSMSFDSLGNAIYSSATGVFISVDPEFEKYPGISSYAYCMNNPVKYIDPTGMYVEVIENSNGTYTVKRGEQNNDRNIYIIDNNYERICVEENGEQKYKILGKTFTDYSFFSDDNNIIENVIIDPKDKSGQGFLDKLKLKDPDLIEYIPKASTGKYYDFKSCYEDFGFNKICDKNKNLDFNNNRGMQININGNNFYATARDIGNYFAGHTAGRNSLSWAVTRFGFDGLQTKQDFSNDIKNINNIKDIFDIIINFKWSTESEVSQSAQKAGFDATYSNIFTRLKNDSKTKVLDFYRQIYLNNVYDFYGITK